MFKVPNARRSLFDDGETMGTEDDQEMELLNQSSSDERNLKCQETESSDEHSNQSTPKEVSENTEPSASRIMMSNMILGSSDYQKFFEETLITGLDGYAEMVGIISEIMIEDLKNYFNWYLEADEKAGKKIGLEIVTMKISHTDIFLEENDHGIIDEDSPDFIWDGVVQLSTGQLMKMSVEGFYFVDGTYY